MRVMRSTIAVLMFAAVLGVYVTSIDAAGRPSSEERAPAATSVPAAAQRVSLPSPGLRDEAAMVLVGTALIGLAAAVRRAA
jgi:hypothetical protein